MDVKSRLSALEKRLRHCANSQRPHYTVLLAHGVPPEDWTDEELEAFIRDTEGLPPDTEITDDLLNQLIGNNEEEHQKDNTQ